jgi:hypothetical protein
MAADYFLSGPQRDALNQWIHSKLKPIRAKVDREAEKHLQAGVQNLLIVCLAIAMLSTGWLGARFLLPHVGQTGNIWLVAIAALVFLALIAAALPPLLAYLLGVVLPATTKEGTGLILSWLIHCPKGTIFGLGFLCLAISFTCRWLNT